MGVTAIRKEVRPRQAQPGQWHNQIQAALGDAIICDRCGASIHTYGDTCVAPLDDHCPGFMAIEAAALVRTSLQKEQ